MHRQVILSSLSKPNINIFGEVIAAIEYEFNKSASNIKEMKDRENKKKKGDIWENFCKDWLIASGKYIRVWLLNEYNNEFSPPASIVSNNETNITTISSLYDRLSSEKQRTFISKQDNGIDIIAQTTDGWHAIQCKYRKKGKVSWTSLSTFIALCERTGPWDKYIVMTNSTGVTHKLPKTPKDKSICKGTFESTTRDHWLKMIGKDTGYKLNSVQPIIHPNKTPDLDELRRLRLSRFENK